MNSLSVTEAKARFSELLNRVAHGGETILISRRGKPMAKLVPPQPEEGLHLADIKGWLQDEDLFFRTVDSVTAARPSHRPRILGGETPFSS